MAVSKLNESFRSPEEVARSYYYTEYSEDIIRQSLESQGYDEEFIKNVFKAMDDMYKDHEDISDDMTMKDHDPESVSSDNVLTESHELKVGDPVHHIDDSPKFRGYISKIKGSTAVVSTQDGSSVEVPLDKLELDINESKSINEENDILSANELANRVFTALNNCNISGYGNYIDRANDSVQLYPKDKDISEEITDCLESDFVFEINRYGHIIVTDLKSLSESKAIKESSLPTRNSSIDLDRIALDIWDKFQPENLGEDNWIEFDYQGVQRTTAGTEVLNFRAIGPDDKVVKGAMRSSNNHLFVRAGDDREVREFFSVDEVADYIQSKFTKQECLTEEFDEKEISKKLDQFQSQITVDSSHEKDMKSLLRKKNVAFMIDDSKEGKLTFKLKYESLTESRDYKKAIDAAYTKGGISKEIEKYLASKGISEENSETIFGDMTDDEIVEFYNHVRSLLINKQKIPGAEINTELYDLFDLEESLAEAVVNGEDLRYVVINPDGTYAGVACTTYEEACELAAQKEGRQIFELRELVSSESLQENIPPEFKVGDVVIVEGYIYSSRNDRTFNNFKGSIEKGPYELDGCTTYDVKVIEKLGLCAVAEVGKTYPVRKSWMSRV